MGDLISREGTKLKVARKLVELKKAGASWSDLALGSLDAIDDVPAVDAEPVRRGRWIEKEDHIVDDIVEEYYECSECGRTWPVKEPYCHCGAKMKEEEKSDPRRENRNPD